MYAAKKLVIMFLLAFSIFISTVLADDGPSQGKYNDDGMSPTTTTGCGNCSICPYTCHTTPPPPPAPSPPSYGTPPSPPTAQVSNCPPAAPVQCCQSNSPPSPFYHPYYNESSSSAASLQPVRTIKAPLVTTIITSTRCSAVFFAVSVIFSLI